MEPIDYGGALRRSWRLLIALAILGAVIAVLVPASHPKKVKSDLPYTATAVVGSPPPSPNSPLNGGVANAQIAYIGNETGTLQDVADTAGLDVPVSSLPGYLSASIVAAAAPGSAQAGSAVKITRNTPTVVRLTANGSSAAQAIQLANTYAVVLQGDVGDAANARQAGNPRAGNGPVNTGYTVLQTATSAAHGTHAKTSLTASRKVRAVGGLVVGVLVGAAVVLLRELLDKRLRNAARAEANFGFPVVAEIPSGAVGPSAAVTGLAPMVDVIRDPDSPGAEAYRMLRMSVMFEGLASLSGPTDPYALGFDAGTGAGMAQIEQQSESAGEEIGDRRVVLIVSAGKEPSRPYVAANLAAIYAEAGERVVVVSTGEVDARHRGAHATLATGEIRTEDIQSHLEPSRLEYVSRLPLTPFISRSGQLVTRMPSVLEAARPLSDVVIVEVPPILAVHHAEALVRCVDVVLVVAECRVTTFDHARRAGDLLRRMGAPVLGVVLTGTRPDRSDIQPAVLAGPSANGQPTNSPEEDGVVAIGAGVGPSAAPASDSPV